EYHDDDPCQVRLRWGDDARPRPPQPVFMAAPMVPAPRSSARDAALGVTVELQYTLEEYDIVSLSATQSDGLETWLNENGYRIPRGASAVLRPYINQGMKFFVAKVNLQEQARLGYKTLRPLQFAFESEKFMLPMRLGMLNAPPGKAQELIVYVLTRQGRVESSNYRTVKLPANMNLPYFVKPKFAEFYKAMFEREAKKADHRVVFTEYFWDMAWCDPCADRPLTTEELRKSGAFWVGGNEDANFRALLGRPAAPAVPGAGGRELPPGAQPVVLTRLHLRYTPESFPEDLMFTQTRDRQNWQARYVIQTPYNGSPAQCSAKVGEMECAGMCRPRVQEVLKVLGQTSERTAPVFRDKDPLVLQRDCVASCEASKRDGVAAAVRYYERELPDRMRREKQVLAQLTGWSPGEVDALPQATAIRTKEPAPGASGGWWQRLFEQRR
ncbi:MAG TPA: DUF2330 domain-containing protein, partial [Ramlibacter sp.]